MSISKIQSESINLADNFAFTGTVTGAGEANTPHFKAFNNATFTFSQNTTTIMRMNTVAFESNSGSFSTSNYNFTVPSGEGGKYFLTASMRLNGTTNNYAGLYFFVDGTETVFANIEAAMFYSFISPLKSIALYCALPLGGSADVEDLLVEDLFFTKVPSGEISASVIQASLTLGVSGSSEINFPDAVLALFLLAIISSVIYFEQQTYSQCSLI